MFAAAAVLLFLVERLLPNPLPWVRLGLANAVTLVVLWEYGVRAAAIVVVLRLVLGGFFSAGLMAPQFWLALSGASASFVVMAVALRCTPAWWSPLGVSVLGSVGHAVAQLVVVAFLFGAGRGILAFLPLFVGVSLLTGIVTGSLADALLARMELSRLPSAGALRRP
jgi:heptaprenyl diphosphate synthase